MADPTTIAHVEHFERVLSRKERRRVNRYLARKYLSRRRRFWLLIRRKSWR